MKQIAFALIYLAMSALTADVCRADPPTEESSPATVVLNSVTAPYPLAQCCPSVGGGCEPKRPDSQCDHSHPPPKRDHSWHALVTNYGGKVSLISGLTRHEANMLRCKLMQQPCNERERRLQQEEYERNNPTCPPLPRSKEIWEQWNTKHPGATGCIEPDGRGAMGWGGGRLLGDGDVKSVELFQ